ncbi:MAG: hypothetical protein F4149_10405 [Gammaproteobacteria bacterium]|nr:hypothetical protein [Gammaproteobacteria bacterium]MYK83167.1 hypothetical protein [Gammaproteobacteria bacterium]
MRIEAYDDACEGYDPLELSIGAGETVHFNSDDLELGNAGKGLAGSTGPGAGKWRLSAVGEPGVLVQSLLESPTGHLTNLSALPQ